MIRDLKHRYRIWKLNRLRDSITLSDAYAEAMQWRDWALCDELLEPFYDRMAHVQALREAGL